jgi:hypothetical protein
MPRPTAARTQTDAASSCWTTIVEAPSLAQPADADDDGRHEDEVRVCEKHVSGEGLCDGGLGCGPVVSSSASFESVGQAISHLDFDNHLRLSADLATWP